jgi:hypothetical protein
MSRRFRADNSPILTQLTPSLFDDDNTGKISICNYSASSKRSGTNWKMTV